MSSRMLRILLFLFLQTSWYHYVKCSTSFDVEESPLSNRLRWNYTNFNPNCTDAGGGMNPCQDERICRFAVASHALGGKPTVCGWVREEVPKVCCGLPLVLGKDLMDKVEEEKARRRGCGTRSWSLNLSPTENKFFEILKTIPEVDTSDPNKFDPPLDLTVQTMASSTFSTGSRQGDFPWVVAIFLDGLTSPWCSGSLIDRSHVLSSANCFVNHRGKVDDPSEYTVRVGNSNVYGGFPFSVVKIKVHEKYELEMISNDIAILTLEKEILTPYVAHICLPDETLAAMDLTGKSATRVVWEGNGINPFLNIVDDLSLVSTAECNRTYQNILSNSGSSTKGITDEFICAGPPEGGKDFCLHVPGGPLMYKNNYLDLPEYDSSIPWVLVGLQPTRYMCEQPGDLDVYTRISSHMDWIQKNIS